MGTYTIECNIGAACPICGADTEHSDDERDGDMVHETYKCENCRVYITFTWKQPHPTHDELYNNFEATQKQVDRAEQSERWARDQGTITFELMLGHGWLDEEAD